MIVLCLVVVAACAAPAAYAQSTWNGATNGLWSVDSNWSAAPGGNGFNTGLVFAGSNNLSTNNDLTSGTATSITFNAGSGAFTLAGNSITLSGSIGNSATGNTQTISLPMALTAATHTVAMVSGGRTELSGNLSGGHSAGSTSTTISVTGSGSALVLSGSNSFGGYVGISSGTLVMGSQFALGASTVSFASTNNTAFDVTSGSSFSVSNNVRLGSANGTFAGSGGGSFISSGTFIINGGSRSMAVNGGTFGIAVISATSGTQTLTKSGSGTMIVSGSAGTLGGFTLSGGALAVGHNNALGSGTFQVTASATVRAYNADITLPNVTTITSSTLTIDGSNSLGFSGDFTQSGGNRSVSNVLPAGKSLTFSGTTFLQEGASSSGRTLTVTGTGDTVFFGPIVNGGSGGSSGLSINSTGVTTLSSSNSYTGNTALTGKLSKIVLGDNFAFGPSGTVSTDLGVGTSSITLQALKDLTGVPNVVTLGNSTGTATFSGTNGMVFAGGLRLDGSRSIANALVGKTLEFSGTTVLGLVGSSSPRTLTVSGSGHTLFSGPIINGGTSGNGSLTIANTGTTTLASSVNTYGGSTSVSGGATLVLTNNASLGLSTLNVSGTATLQASSDLTNVPNPVTVGSSLLVNGANSIAFTGPVTNSGGSRTITNSLPAGKTLLFSGVTALQESGTNVGRTLTVAGSGNTRFDGQIVDGGTGGASSLTVNNTGTTTLAAANTYTGPTNVNAGSLVVNGSLTSLVALASSASLGGSGSVGAISGAGLVGPGNSPGILTAPGIDATGGLDFAFEFSAATPDYANPTNSENDVLWLTGGTPFTSSLSGSNTVNIYFTQAAVELGTLTGGFFTSNTGDFLASIGSATFQFFVQDVNGSTVYNNSNYKTLAQYDPSKTFTISTVAENGGQVMQMVVVPEPGALLLAGMGVVLAAWTARRRAR